MDWFVLCNLYRVCTRILRPHNFTWITVMARGPNPHRRLLKFPIQEHLTETKMSNPCLPAELLDYIADLLHDRKVELRNCCLVSKSWIPRTRKHLFADIKFYIEKDLESWKEVFSDPSTSPACYARTLMVDCPHLVTTADAEEGGWIKGFSRVVHLEVGSRLYIDGSRVSFVPLHRLSPVVKSFRTNFVILPSSQILDLILSFPLLEDLTAVAHSVGGSDRPPTVVQPSSPPAFTGTLNLFLTGGTEHITRRLLSLPGGIHFRELVLTWFREEDPSLTMALVDKCSHTIEALDITCHLGKPILHRGSQRFLILYSSQVGRDRPLESDKTQKSSFSIHIVDGSRMDRHGIPNHHPQTSGTQTNHDPHSLRFSHHRLHSRIRSLWAVVEP